MINLVFGQRRIINSHAMESHWTLFIPLVLMLWISVKTEIQEVCNAENFDGTCHEGSVIVMESALYGVMKLARCLEIDLGYLGCKNDVLYLADRWCSGRQECIVVVPNQELKAANTECDVGGLAPYMELEYTCVAVATAGQNHCHVPKRLQIHGNEGYISSLVAEQTGCGSPRAPWVIEVPPGQIIDMWLLDFGALGRQERTIDVGCQQTLGFIVERNLGSNLTICGDTQRRKPLYTSKTNKIEISLMKNYNGNEHGGYLIKYKVVGCSDLTPPAHAWHKRESSEAVIGCKSNDRVWRLYCNGNTWDGVVGNCSASKDAGHIDLGVTLPFSSVIFLTCVVCGAILLIIVVVVAGAVYVKKQSIRHEIKLRSDYVCTTLPSAQYFPTKTLGYDVSLSQVGHAQRIDDNQPLVQISDKTLHSIKNPVDMTLMQTCACSTSPRNSENQ